MKYKYNYDGTTEGQAAVVAEHSDMILVEIQDITEGHFLVFSDTKETTTTSSTAEQLETINSNIITVMDALATVYEAVTTDTTTT